MRCRRCGTELPEDARFCLHCGAPVPGAPSDEGDGDSSAEGDRDSLDGTRVTAETDLDSLGGGEFDDDFDDDEYDDSDLGDSGDEGDDDRRLSDEEVFAEGEEDVSADATREVPVGATALRRQGAPVDETRVARRREETAVRGETTLLDRGEGAGPERGAAAPVGAGTSEPTEPAMDPLDAVEDPYEGIAQPFRRDETAAPLPPPEPKRTANRTMMYVFVGIAAVVVAAVIGAFVTWRMELWGGTTVPDVMGLPEAEATAQLTDAGFEVAIQPVVVDEGVGTVVSMQPQAGRRVQTGRTVELGIGADRSVPDVEGLPIADARARLNASGIDHLRLEYQNSSATKGSVIAISPAPGTKVAADEVVTLVVAQPYTVPDVIGLTTEAAEAALERAGLAGTVRYVSSDTVDPGRVVSSDPVAGTELDEGATVALGVSSPYPTSLFDLEGYLTARPEDVAVYLDEQGYGIDYARDDDGVAEMTWTPRSGSGRGLPAVAFSELPFSLPRGWQLFPRDVIAQGAAIRGVYLQVGSDAGDLDLGSALGSNLGSNLGYGADASPSASGSPGTRDGAAIDSRAAGGEGSVDLDVSQDCVTRLMNLCGLRSTADTTTTATQENVVGVGVDVNLAAKAGVMDSYTWYVVVWEPASRAGEVSVSVGMASTERLQGQLASHGIDLADYGDSMASLAASLVLSGGVPD